MFVLIFTVVVLACIFPFFLYHANKAEKQRKEEQYRNKCLQFYERCLERGLDVTTVDANILIVANNCGIAESEVAQALVIGKEAKEKAIADQKQQAINEYQQKKMNRQEQQITSFSNEKRLAMISGKAKYTADMIARYNKQAAKVQSARNDMDNATNPFMAHEKDNWGYAGGLASAIAGPGAGAMAAMDYHNKTVENNRRADAHNAQLLKMGIYNADGWKTYKRDQYEWAKEALDTQYAFYQKFDALLVDANPSVDISFDVTGALDPYGPSGYMKLTIVPKVEGETTVMGNPAVVDGSYRIRVHNAAGEVVGVAYCSANGFGRTDLTKVGFANTKEMTAVAIPLTVDQFDPAETYRFSMEPIHLWAIEDGCTEEWEPLFDEAEKQANDKNYKRYTRHLL